LTLLTKKAAGIFPAALKIEIKLLKKVPLKLFLFSFLPSFSTS
jgi:hypothetical protein